ncbi:hypothetical protein BJ878DRAFT_154532 [Calycina marina]|uniref:SH3 domain-containing protein n=1 Tax=Calycina marina TaxID=1763456 RepID=A0A9P7Z0Q7_9HELO|nr:hypothetical protein BJ878DRAFT_154532 [Calycina marina]
MVHRHEHRRQAREALAFVDQGHQNDDREAEAVQTIYSVVYKTASKTFDGPIAGYTTIGVPAASSSTEVAAAVPTTTLQAVAPSSTSVVVAAAQSSSQETSTEVQIDESQGSQTSQASQTTLQTSAATGAILSIAASAVSSVNSDLGIIVASSTTTDVSTPTYLVAAASSTSSASAKSSSSSDGGMSSAAKAGLGIGIVLLIGTAVSIVLFFFKKRRNAQKERDALSEKAVFTPSSPNPRRESSTRTTATAPRLSLRPVTQFMAFNEKRNSRLNNASTEKALPAIGQDANMSNPFGNHAETIDSSNANGPAVVSDVGSGGELIAVGATGLARGASRRTKPLDLTNSGPSMANNGPPSPTGTEFSMTSDGPNTPTQTSSSAAIAAAGGPANSSVHRVQLDFKPSMDDELGLHAGQLVRMLHEYDDGWALCIRLDRSAQGVVPRTCLSTRPVKPRPQQNGPRGPPPGMRIPVQGRGPAMNNGLQRPMTPTGGPQVRSMTPNSQHSRPMTPQGCLTKQNGPQYKSQSPSNEEPRTSMADRRNSPPVSSPMNPTANPNAEFAAPVPTDGPIVRKPVGQAL